MGWLRASVFSRGFLHESRGVFPMLSPLSRVPARTLVKRRAVVGVGPWSAVPVESWLISGMLSACVNVVSLQLILEKFCLRDEDGRT